jgi:hypothetical protein
MTNLGWTPLVLFDCEMVNFGSKYLRFCSEFVQHIHMYMYSFERFFSQLYNDVIEIIVGFVDF